MSVIKNRQENCVQMGDKVMMVATAELTQGAASPGARGTALCGQDPGRGWAAFCLPVAQAPWSTLPLITAYSRGEMALTLQRGSRWGD